MYKWARIKSNSYFFCKVYEGRMATLMIGVIFLKNATHSSCRSLTLQMCAHLSTRCVFLIQFIRNISNRIKFNNIKNRNLLVQWRGQIGKACLLLLASLKHFMRLREVENDVNGCFILLMHKLLINIRHQLYFKLWWHKLNCFFFCEIDEIDVFISLNILNESLIL